MRFQYLLQRIRMGGSKEGAGGLNPPLLKNHKNIGFLRNTGKAPNPKATKPAFNVGLSMTRQRNADDGPFIVEF